MDNKNKQSHQSQTQQQDEIIDITKTVPISKQEQNKLAAFLSKIKSNIQGDQQLIDILGATVNKWSHQLESKNQQNEQQK